MSTAPGYPMTPIRTPAPGRGRSPFTLENLDFEPACAHHRHAEGSPFHEGPAAWLQTGTCQKCGATLTALVCDRWRTTVSEWARIGLYCTCPTCHTSSDPNTNLAYIRL